MNSCKQRCLTYLKNNHDKWIAKGHIADLARARGGYTGEMTGRRLRELAEEGAIEVMELKGHAHYRYSNYREERRLAGLRAFDAL